MEKIEMDKRVQDAINELEASSGSGLLILITALVWISYDIYAYIYGGAVSTISAVVTDFSYYSPALPFLTGGLCGHWFFPAKRYK